MQGMVKKFSFPASMRRLMMRAALGLALPMALWPLKVIYRQPSTLQ